MSNVLEGFGYFEGCESLGSGLCFSLPASHSKPTLPTKPPTSNLIVAHS